MPHTLLIDDSLSLINRTGAFFVARDLVDAFESRAIVRRWRLLGAPLPRMLPRRIVGRLMLKEMERLRESPLLPWPDGKCTKRLFLDPLYVLRSQLSASDNVLCFDVGPNSHADIFLPVTADTYRRAYQKIAAARPGLVFISDTSRRAFEAYFGRNFRFMHTIPLYVRDAAAHGAAEPVPDIGKPFFLSVGGLERRKNHETTLRAFEASGLASQGVTLVLCGSRGDATAEITALAYATPGVRLLGYVSDPQLRWLYQEAVAFVLPSRLEGFGMPALEAAKYGLIPIVSGDSALSEAVGGLGFAVPHDSLHGLAAAMHQALHLPAAERTALQGKLMEHASHSTHARFIRQWQQLIDRETASLA
jgi:glycosyltransferase involved in cell wall biosynthesis